MPLLYRNPAPTANHFNLPGRVPFTELLALFSIGQAMPNIIGCEIGYLGIPSRSPPYTEKEPHACGSFPIKNSV